MQEFKTKDSFEWSVKYASFWSVGSGPNIPMKIIFKTPFLLYWFVHVVHQVNAKPDIKDGQIEDQSKHLKLSNQSGKYRLSNYIRTTIHRHSKSNTRPIEVENRIKDGNFHRSQQHSITTSMNKWMKKFYVNHHHWIIRKNRHQQRS